jgi:hypothetical protein
VSLATVRTGLQARLETLGRAHAFEPEKISPPAFVVPPPESIDYGTTMGTAATALNTYEFTVRAYFSRADARTAQDALCNALEPTGATSVKAAIEGDLQPGVGCLFTAAVPAAEAIRCSSAQNTGIYDVAGVGYVGAEFTVTVYARS